MATTTLNKWGNSNGIIIPKSICDQLNLKSGDKLYLYSDGSKLTIEPQKEFTIESLMKDYAGPKPQAYDWGKPAGKELW